MMWLKGSLRTMEVEAIKIIPFGPDEMVTLSGEVVRLPEYDPEAVLKALQEEEYMNLTDISTHALEVEVMSGNVDAAKEWLKRFDTAVLHKGWWYKQGKKGKVKMSVSEHITQNEAKRLIR